MLLAYNVYIYIYDIYDMYVCMFVIGYVNVLPTFVQINNFSVVAEATGVCVVVVVLQLIFTAANGLGDLECWCKVRIVITAVTKTRTKEQLLLAASHDMRVVVVVRIFSEHILRRFMYHMSIYLFVVHVHVTL